MIQWDEWDILRHEKPLWLEKFKDWENEALTCTDCQHNQLLELEEDFSTQIPWSYHNVWMQYDVYDET